MTNPFNLETAPSFAGVRSIQRQRWLEETCALGGRARAGEMMDSWVAYCAAKGWNFPGSARWLKRDLEQAGFPPGRDMYGSYFTGLSLK